MVYYSINPQVLFRHFGDFGYLTDNRNYGYTFSDKKFVLGDEIISDIGADILSCLEKKPCSIDEITNRASKRFEPTQNLRNNIITFLDLLSSKGFVNKASSPFDVNKGEQLHNIYKERAGIFQHNEEDKSTIKTTDFLLQHFGDKTFLKSLHIEIVSECNERCIHCYIPHEFKTELMEESLFFSILEQAKKLNLLHITISGGEPMLHPHFLDFVKKCRECDMSVNVLSNLTKLNSTMIDEMKRNPLLCVQTSIYSMDPEVHDHITCHKGSLKKTEDAVCKLIDNNIPVQINCPILQDNWSCYKDVLYWAFKHNISASADYSIIAKFDHHKDNLNCRLSEVELKDIIDDKLHHDFSFLEDIEKEVSANRTKSLNDNVCTICDSSLCISPNGNVFPCVGWTDKILGSLNKYFLEDIWNSSEEIKKLRSIKNKDFSECISCNQKDFCTICMVRNSNESSTGNPFEVNRYFCTIARIKKQLYEETNQGHKLKTST